VPHRRSFNKLAGAHFTEVPLNHVWVRTMTQCAAVCASVGDVERAALLTGLLDPYAALTPAGFGVSGSVTHYLGLLATCLGHFEEAESRFRMAEAAHSRMGAPTWLARTRLEWARTLLTRGRADDVEPARRLVNQALAAARDLGLCGVERRAVALHPDLE
jgi:hypothetical protein